MAVAVCVVFHKTWALCYGKWGSGAGAAFDPIEVAASRWLVPSIANGRIRRSFHILLEVVERIASISRSEGIAKAPFHCYISPSTKAGTVGEQNEWQQWTQRGNCLFCPHLNWTRNELCDLGLEVFSTRSPVIMKEPFVTSQRAQGTLLIEGKQKGRKKATE